MLPGKIAIKKAAVARPKYAPTVPADSRPRPRIISTAPEARTTKSGSSGSHTGT
jgi:hypothetical protein